MKTSRALLALLAAVTACETNIYSYGFDETTGGVTTDMSGEGDESGDGSGDGDGDHDGDGDPAGDGDGDGDPAGDGDGCPHAIECDDAGRCWAHHPDWDASAQAFDEDGLDEGVIAGTLEPTVPPSALVECWRYGSPGDYGTVCRLPTTCYDLTAIPLEQVYGASVECQDAPGGAWDYTVKGSFGCYGVFGDLGLAVSLRP